MYTEDVKEYKAFMEKIANANIEASDEFGTVVSSFVKYILELESGIEVLVDKRESIGMAYVIRGQYEMFLQLAYLIEYLKTDPNKCTRNARCYKYYHWFQTKRWATILGIKEHIEEIEKIILSQYADIEKEWKRKNGGKKNFWFALFDGPKTIDKLEEYFNAADKIDDERRSLYDVLSRLCHGKSAIRDYSKGASAINLQGMTNTSIELKTRFVHRLVPFSIEYGIDVSGFNSYLASKPV